MQNRKAEIILIGDEEQPTYSRCALPFALAGEVALENTVVFPERQFARAKIGLIKPATVEEIDTQRRLVRYRHDSGTREAPFDALVYATGGYAAVPKIEGTDLDGNFVLRTYKDAARLMGVAKAGMTAVVNGASFVALEVAEAFKKRNLNVHLIIRSRPLRSFLDEPLSALVKKYLESCGIIVHQGAEIERIVGSGKVEAVVAGGQKIECDFVVHATGTRPNIQLAKTAGLAIGKTGGVATDKHLQTSVEAVYAAGDCAEVQECVAGQRVVSGLGTTAMRHGMVAGRNAAGAELPATPTTRAAVMKLFNLQIGSVGLTQAQADTAGLDVAAAQIKHPALPHYWPHNEEVTIRLLFERRNGRIVGAQILGETAIALRVNMLSLAIQQKMTVADLAAADFCYSPPCADIWAPEAVCATTALRRLETTK